MGNFPNCLAYILAYFSLYNFYTTPEEKKLFRYLKLCIHISLAIWCTFISFQSFSELICLMERLDVLNFIIYYTNHSLTYWLIIYESYKYRADIRGFWNLLTQIDDQYFNQLTFKPQIYLLIVIVIPFIDVACNTFAIFNEQTSRTVQKIMFLIFINVSFNRLLFYLLHLKVIKFQLQRIQIELYRIKNSDRFNITNIQSNTNFECKMRFKWIRNYYCIVHEMSQLVNSTFGWSQLAFVLLNSHCFITFINFFYRQMNLKFVGFNYGKKNIIILICV